MTQNGIEPIHETEESDNNTDATEHTDPQLLPVDIDDNTELVFSQELLFIAQRWSMIPQPTKQHELKISMYASDIQEVVDSWNPHQIYDGEDPQQRLVGRVKDLLENWEQTSGSKTDVATWCRKEIEQAIERKEKRVKLTAEGNDNVTLLIEKEDSEVKDAKILDQHDSKETFKRQHEGLLDYTEVKHTTREEAETFIKEHCSSSI